MKQLVIFALKNHYLLTEFWFEVISPPTKAQKKAKMAGKLMTALIDLYDLDPQAHKTMRPLWIDPLANIVAGATP